MKKVDQQKIKLRIARLQWSFFNFMPTTNRPSWGWVSWSS